HYFALRFDRALEAVARARALAPPGSVMELVCDSTECEILFYSDRFAESERLARRLLEAAGASEDPEVVGIRAQGCQRMAELAILRGDLEQAREWRERTLACAEATGQTWRARVAKLNLGDVLFVLGREEEALALCEEVIAEAKAERDRDGIAAGMEDRAHLE